MRISQEMVRGAVASAAGVAGELPDDVALGALGINSLALLSVFIKLEEASGIRLSRQDAEELSRSSIDQIVDWFTARCG